jgi:putative membrane protein
VQPTASHRDRLAMFKQLAPRRKLTMTLAFESLFSRAAASSKRRHAPHARLTPWLIVAIGLCTSAACSDDDDDDVIHRGITAGSNSGGNGTGGNGAAGRGTAGAGGTNAAGASGTTTTGTGGASAGMSAGTSATSTGTATGAQSGGAGGSTGTDPDAGAAADNPPPNPAADLNDAQMVFVLDTINAGEIDQARAALPGLEDEAVRAYAQLMIEEHEPARNRLLQLAQTEDIGLESSDVATQLRDESEEIIDDLLARSGDDLERTYLQAQVTGHQQALQLIDAMIPAADSDALDGELGQLRASVAAHLEAAQQLVDAATDADDADDAEETGD